MMIEQNTNYAYKLKHMDNPSFDKVRDLSTKFYRELPQALQDELHEVLHRGVDILDSEPQMTAYLYAFGKMHQAKLNYAFGKLPEEFLEQPEINIVDYGCGQALGTMCYADFLHKKGYSQKVKNITLIEPSEICLKRAALHASVFFPDGEIKTVNKKFDDLTQDDIVCTEGTPTLHVLSNVLDVTCFDLGKFSELIKGCLKGHNQFVCVGPYFGKDSDRSKRMDDFANNLKEGVIYTVDLNSNEFYPNNSWTCMVRCFGVGNLGIALHKEEAGTVNSNVKPLFIDFLTYKGMRKVFLGVKEIINPVTNQKERWQELLLGTSMDDPNAEIIRISSELGTINTSFLIQNKDILQVFSLPNYKHKILCIEDRPESTLRENLSTEVTNKDIEDGIKDEYGVIYSKDGKRLVSAENCDCKTYTINKGIKVICDRAFYCCESLQSIVIPNNVTKIGDSAFSSCLSLQTIVIPNSVTNIGDSAFGDCKSLQSISIPNSVTNIEDWAFRGCDSLQSIVIPENVTSIGKGAFVDCHSLQSIVIPESVISIGVNPFEDSGVRTIVSHSKFFTVDRNALYDQKKKLLIACFSKGYHFVIPDNVTSIGDWAFANCYSLQSISIPNSVTNIGDRAFLYCKSLQSIVIPNSVTNIGDSAFGDCKSLQSIIIPNSVTNIGDSAFGDCKSLQSIIIPNSVTSIGDRAFSFCTSLQSISIPNSVTSVGDKAFSFCTSLQSIVIPESVTSIGDLAFNGCESLQSIVIPESVTSIGANPFENSGVRSIVSHSKFFTVDRKALYDQKKKLLIACFSKGYHFVIPDNVTSIGDSAFSWCKSLQSIVIPNSVTSIGDRAFRGCESLQSIVIPNSVTSIGAEAFASCYSLQSIVIPNSMKSIGHGTFNRCASLQSIVIPNSVKSIEHGAFNRCASLQSIVIPDSVTSIGEWAFIGCKSLRTIIIPKGSRKKFEKLLPDDIDKLEER